MTKLLDKPAAMPSSKRRNGSNINHGLTNRGVCIKWGLVAVGLTISVSQAKAEYRVNIGDVLEVGVAGVPARPRRAARPKDGKN